MVAVNTTLTLTPVMQIYYDKVLLDRLEAQLHFQQLATKKNIPKNAGKVIYFTRYQNLNEDTTPLQDGVVPSAVSLSANNISATLESLGSYTTTSDLLVMTAIDNQIKSALEVLSYKAAKSVDSYIRSKIDAAVPASYANGRASAGDVLTTDVLNASELRKMVRTLKGRDVPPHSGGDYILVVHPFQAYNLQSDTAVGGWLDVNKYVSNTTILNGEIGKIYGARVLESTNLTSDTISGSETGYYAYMFGFNSFATVNISGGALKTYVKPAGSAGSLDPLEQINAIGYKIIFAAAVLDPNRIVRLLTGVAQ